VDAETINRAIAALDAMGEAPEPTSVRAVPVAKAALEAPTMTHEELAELEELYRVDNEARARRGLPLRYPMQRAA
jgi:hypothetical protein